MWNPETMVIEFVNNLKFYILHGIQVSQSECIIILVMQEKN